MNVTHPITRPGMGSNKSKNGIRSKQTHRSMMLMALLSCIMGQNTPSYCPLTKRYDVGEFPPRCMDCVRVLSNRMQVARVKTMLQTKRTVQKFSPGLPQNQTCGCWRTPVNQTVFEVALNASWVVSGLEFSRDRNWWLKEIEVQASDNNLTYMPWGVYSMPNFTDASLALFMYPIRARYFKITVRKYANHFVNSSIGYPLSPINALVSLDQPFSCACPTLSNGECCPFLNMTFKNDQCVWCMDPMDINTRMVDGCAKCKAGTFEFQGRCYKNIARNLETNTLSVGNPQADGIEWKIQVNYTIDRQSVMLLFFTNKTGRRITHPCIERVEGVFDDNQTSALSSACCLRDYYNSSTAYNPIIWNFTPPLTVQNESSLNRKLVSDSCTIESVIEPPAAIKQFVQFDRGRRSVTLSLTQKELQAWAACNPSTCTGSVAALFLTLTTPLPTTSFIPQLIQQPLRFDMNVPSLVCTTTRELPTQARAELHYYVATHTYTVRVLGVKWNGGQIRFQWTNSDTWAYTENALEFVVTSPPEDDPYAALRIGNDVHMLRIDPPMAPVVHGTVKQSVLEGILVEMAYGFGFSRMPSIGDTEQIIIITAKSVQPARLKRLASSQNGETTAYTNAKGFISDSKRVMDLGVACYQDKSLMVKWLLQAIQLLDTPGVPHATFIQYSCRMVWAGEVAKAYWLVPWRGGVSVDRTLPAGVEVVVEFV